MPPNAPVSLVQRAIYEYLCADATLVAMLAPTASGAPGISDQPRANAPFPRVEIDAFHAVPSHCLGPRTGPKYGWEISAQIKALSTYPGNLEIQTIISRITGLLQEPVPPLIITGFPDVECRVRDVGPEYLEPIGSVIVRHLPIIIEVQVREG